MTTDFLTLAEVQKILCYRSRGSASSYIKKNKITFIVRTQAILVEARSFYRHLESVGFNLEQGSL